MFLLGPARDGPALSDVYTARDGSARPARSARSPGPAARSRGRRARPARCATVAATRACEAARATMAAMAERVQVEVDWERAIADRAPITAPVRSFAFGEPLAARREGHEVLGRAGWDPTLRWVLVVDEPGTRVAREGGDGAAA